MFNNIKHRLEIAKKNIDPWKVAAVAGTGTAVFLGSYILGQRVKTQIGITSFLADMATNGFVDLDAGDKILRATLINKD